MSDHWFAVLNPKSAGGRAARDRGRISEALRSAGVEFELAVSSQAGHALTLATDAALRGYRKFVAIGGDGTLNELLNGALASGAVDPSDIVLAAIPVGRGNDWARGHHIPRRYAAAARLIADESTVRHDVGVVENITDEGCSVRHFLNVAGAGFDAHVVSLVQGNRWGGFSYLAALPAGFASYASPVLSIAANGETSTADVFVVFAAIGRYCGGGMLVAPDAKSDDGLLDVVIVENISKWELLLNIRRLFDGTIGTYKKARCLRAPSIEISAPVPVASEADGELLSSTPLSISILQNGIRVVTPG
jgi:YegS/Rv2252/BmrU family lipid kinase